MSKAAVITLFALFISACVPIPREPSQAVCREGFVVMRAGQSAYDPIVSDLPGHVDIVKAETSLDGETLTAAFHFKDIPERNDTLTMTAHVPGINQDSTVLFLVEDYLSGMDGVSCEAN